MRGLKKETTKRECLQGKTVVLTGASRGIGREISQRLAQHGTNIIGIARDPEGLSQWQKKIEGMGVRAEVIAFDLSHTQQLPELANIIQQRAIKISDTKEKASSLDILINNAGIEIYSAFQDYSLEDIEKVVRVNLLAAMALTRLLLPILSTQGHIVNMASLASKKGHPFDSIYAASKAGLLMWNHSLRQELTHTELGISAICPGYVSDQGMLADTGTQAPWLSGRSQAKAVAHAVLAAIEHRHAEVIVNQDPITEAMTRGLLAIEQIFPKMNDVSNRWLGITAANKQRAAACQQNSSPILEQRESQTT